MSETPLLLVPMRSEMLAVRLGAPRASIERIGMGKKRAIRSNELVLEREPAGRPVLLLGVCGALVPGLSPGDVIIASSVSEVGTSKTLELEGADRLAQLLESRRRSVRVAPIVSSPTIIHGDQARSEAALDGAVAVDMESYWCARLSDRHPFAVVRVVLDVFGRRMLSPHMVSAGVRSFRSLMQVTKVLANSFPNIRSSSLKEIGDQ